LLVVPEMVARLVVPAVVARLVVDPVPVEVALVLPPTAMRLVPFSTEQTVAVSRNRLMAGVVQPPKEMKPVKVGLPS